MSSFNHPLTPNRESDDDLEAYFSNNYFLPEGLINSEDVDTPSFGSPFLTPSSPFITPDYQAVPTTQQLFSWSSCVPQLGIGVHPTNEPSSEQFGPGSLIGHAERSANATASRAPELTSMLGEKYPIGQYDFAMVSPDIELARTAPAGGEFAPDNVSSLATRESLIAKEKHKSAIVDTTARSRMPERNRPDDKAHENKRMASKPAPKPAQPIVSTQDKPQALEPKKMPPKKTGVWVPKIAAQQNVVAATDSAVSAPVKTAKTTPADDKIFILKRGVKEEDLVSEIRAQTAPPSKSEQASFKPEPIKEPAASDVHSKDSAKTIAPKQHQQSKPQHATKKEPEADKPEQAAKKAKPAEPTSAEVSSAPLQPVGPIPSTTAVAEAEPSPIVAPVLSPARSRSPAAAASSSVVPAPSATAVAVPVTNGASSASSAQVDTDAKKSESKKSKPVAKESKKSETKKKAEAKKTAEVAAADKPTASPSSVESFVELSAIRSKIEADQPKEPVDEQAKEPAKEQSNKELVKDTAKPRERAKEHPHEPVKEAEAKHDAKSKLHSTPAKTDLQVVSAVIIPRDIPPLVAIPSAAGEVAKFSDSNSDQPQTEGKKNKRSNKRNSPRDKPAATSDGVKNKDKEPQPSPPQASSPVAERAHSDSQPEEPLQATVQEAQATSVTEKAAFVAAKPSKQSPKHSRRSKNAEPNGSTIDNSSVIEADHPNSSTSPPLVSEVVVELAQTKSSTDDAQAIGEFAAMEQRAVNESAGSLLSTMKQSFGSFEYFYEHVLLQLHSNLFSLHRSAIEGLMLDMQVGLTFVFIYCFPYIASLTQYLFSPLGPVFVWYAFLVWFFLTARGTPQPPPAKLRFVIPLLFIFEGICNPRFVVQWNGCERIALAFLLLSMKCYSAFRENCLITMTILVSLSVSIGSNPFSQWVSVVLALATLPTYFNSESLEKQFYDDEEDPFVTSVTWFDEFDEEDEESGDGQSHKGTESNSEASQTLTTSSAAGDSQSRKKKSRSGRKKFLLRSTH